MHFLKQLFSAEGFMPHGHCYLWQTEVLWLHVVSDTLITLAYLTIPVTLIYIARKRKDLPFDWMFACFGIFILACGATHALHVWTIWDPIYRLSGAMKSVTAVASVATAILLVKLIPQLLAIPSTATLRAANQALEKEIVERQRAEGAIRELQSQQAMILDSISEGIHWIDKTGRIIFENPAAARMLGWDAAELIGRPAHATMHHTRADGGPYPQGECPIYAGMRDGQPRRVTDEVFWRKDGTSFSVEYTSSPARDETGEIAGAVVVYTDTTARQREADALQRQQAELQVLFDLVPAMIWFKDTKIGFLRVNRRVAETTGMAIEEIEGKTAEEIFPQQAAGYYADDLEVIRAKAPKMGIVENLRGSAGEDLWVQTDKVPYFDHDGNVIGLVAMVHDITARRRTEVALQESEARFRESERFLQATLDALSSHIAILDEEGVIIGVNAAWNQYGDANQARSRLRGLGDNYLQLCDAARGPFSEEAAPMAAGIRAAMAGETDVFELEYPCHAPREQRWFIARVTRFTIDGQVRVVVAHENISARKRAELALSESKRFAESIAGNTTSTIYLFDLETRTTVYANRNAAESLGYSPAQMAELGENFLPMIMHPEDLPRVRQRHAEFAEVTDNRVLDLEFQVKAANGEWRWTWTRETVFNRRPNGAAWQILGTALDVTERRRIEQELSAAKEAAEAANRAKSEFLANMSHEIRTPMNGLLGMTDLVLDSPLTEEQRNYLDMAKTSGVALLELINSILDFSKIEAGKLELEAIDFSLRETIAQVLQPLVIRAGQKGLEWRTEIADGLPEYLLGDPLRLRQILLNFTDNALKFTESGSVVVKVVEEGSVDGEHCLHFSITDTGIGVPQEKQQAIFEAFAQADNSTTRQFGGTGLGLAIVSQLVEQMRGAVWMESAVGEGTTFHFTAWFSVGQAPARPAESPVLGEAATRPAGLRILLAEDNVINRALATAVLSKRGHRVAHARSGREAVRLASKEKFDLILMDIQMPEMDGFEATRRIRERERDRAGGTTQIVAMTAHALAGDRERCLAAGMDDYLSKPLQKPELLALLGRLANRSGGNAAPKSEPARPLVCSSSMQETPCALRSVFSREKLLEQLDGDEMLLRKMIALFEENTPRLLDDRRGAVARGGAAELANSSHALLSSLGAFGADLAHGPVRQLEAGAEDGNAERNARLLAALECAIGAISPTLAEYAAA